MNDKLTMELLANEGFAVNARRGTAHIFSVEALERFLKTNQLTHLVRAHEVAQAGFQVRSFKFVLILTQPNPTQPSFLLKLNIMFLLRYYGILLVS